MFFLFLFFPGLLGSGLGLGGIGVGGWDTVGRYDMIMISIVGIIV